MAGDPLWENPAPVPASPSADGIGAALSLSAVSLQTGISATTLRVWQTRHGLGPGLTSPGGHRRYTAGDIRRLRRVKRLVAEGLTASEAVHAVLAAARSDLGLPAEADPVAHHLGAAALELDGPTVRRLIDEHLRQGDVATTWETVIRPVLGAIGDRWSRLSYGIAVEHLVSGLTIELLSSHTVPVDGATTAQGPTADAHGVVLACVPGDRHDLPLIVLDAALRWGGFPAPRRAPPTPPATRAAAEPARPGGVIALRAITDGHAGPALFDGHPMGTRLLALGPGWHPHHLTTRVTPVNTLATARDHITTLVSARVDAGARRCSASSEGRSALR